MEELKLKLRFGNENICIKFVHMQFIVPCCDFSGNAIS